MTVQQKINTEDAMSRYGLESPRAQEMLEAARAMGPALRMRREQCKADARVPDETVREFHEAGFFKVLQPEQWGGYAMDPQVFYAVGLEVAKHCMSSAWVLGVVAEAHQLGATGLGLRQSALKVVDHEVEHERLV